MHDTDTKNLSPILIMLGASDFAKTKDGSMSEEGQIGEPFPEQIKTGWLVMSHGRESDIVSALLT